MNLLQRIGSYFLLCTLGYLSHPFAAFPQTAPAAAKTGAQHAGAERDGQHDFDFEIGAWKTHLSRRLHPLTGSTAWIEMEGTTMVRRIWDGRANLAEFEADGPEGHIQLLSLRLYNPQARQWSLNYANSNSGVLSIPTIGEFKNGRGEFFDQESLNGRTILVRNVWSDITPDSCRFEQAFSDDWGKTWEINWIATDTRVKGTRVKDTRIKDERENQREHQRINDKPENPDASSAALQQSSTQPDGPHGFDFEVGSWNIHLKRLDGRLVGSTTWVEFDGTSVTRKVWGGRADLEEFEVDSPTGHIEGLTLRMYNPQAHQWRLYWANSKNGTLDPPQVGEFKNGRGEFFAQDTIDGRAILIRFVWTDTTTNLPHFEQSFSDDGGKTWEVNWITDQRRVKN